jgi:hypothetical protein
LKDCEPRLNQVQIGQRVTGLNEDYLKNSILPASFFLPPRMQRKLLTTTEGGLSS